MTSAENAEATQAPLIEHLTELRSRLINAVIALFICVIICFVFAQDIYNILTHPLCQELKDRGEECELIFTGLQEKFFTDLRLSLFGGLFLSFPLVANQLWRFVAPGLYREEQAAFRPFLIATPLLFCCGSALVYFFVMPLAFGFFLDYGISDLEAAPPPAEVAAAIRASLESAGDDALTPNAIATAAFAGQEAIQIASRQAMVTEAAKALAEAAPGTPLEQVAFQAMRAGAEARDALLAAVTAASEARTYFLGKVNEYLSLVMTLIFAFGLAFQLPVLLTLLGRAGLVDSDGLARGRKYAVVGILAAAAVLTPPDPFSQLGLGIPIYLLYEISILLVRAVERKRAQREMEDGIAD